MILNFVAGMAFFFLAWTFGRNNLSSLFGAAIGTRMVSFRGGICMAVIGVIAGTWFSSAATTANVSALGHVTRLPEVLSISLSAGLIMLILSRLGVPASLTQTTVGSFIGWNLFYGFALPKELILKTISAWIYTPFIACLVAFLLFCFVRVVLKRYPIRLFWRDHIIRIGLLSVGAFSAYAFGANNIGSVVGPYWDVGLCEPIYLLIGGCLGVCCGFVFADKHVIRTVSSGMFPLSPLEALISVFAGALTLFLFSSVALKEILTALSLPSFPLVPVPLTSAVIGSVIGIAAAKGIEGLRFQLVGKIILSWGIVPVAAGLLCYSFLYLLRFGGIE